MDDDEVGMEVEEVSTGAGEVGTIDEEVETDVGDVVMVDEGDCTDEDVTTGTVGVKVDAAGGTALEDSAATELDTVVGVVESVQFFTSCTSPPGVGIRVIIQVCVTTPVGLEKKKISDAMINTGMTQNIRIDKLNTGDSGGLGSGGLRSGELRELSRGMSRSKAKWLGRWLIRLVVRLVVR